MSQYDVFLSHAGRDKLATRRLASALRDVGLAVWFDEWELKPGASWQVELERAIQSSGATLVAIGPHGVGPWQETEVATAVNYATANRPAVIPVLLPGARNVGIPSFLSGVTYVEIKSWDGPLFDKALSRILWAITGRPQVQPERAKIPKAFLCHAKEDDEKVGELYSRLRGLGLDPWYDKEKLVVGDRWEDEIIAAIEKTDFFAICLSSKSVAKTGFIQREIKLAVKEYQRRPQEFAYLLPIRLEACEVPRLRLDDVTTLPDLQWIDLFIEEEQALERFAEGVRKQFRKQLRNRQLTSA